MTSENASQEVCSGCVKPDRPAALTRSGPKPLAVVLDFPTDRETSRDEWLASSRGGAGEIIKRTLEGLGIDLEEVYFCSALNCRPNPKKKAMLSKGMAACRSRLVEEIRESGAKKVLCFGPLGFSSLTGASKALAITKVRGRWATSDELPGVQILATLPPGFLFTNPPYYRDIIRDVSKFIETDGPEPKPELTYEVPSTLKEAKEVWARVIEPADTVSIDLETYGFSPVSNPILCAGFCVLEEDKKTGHAVIFDEALLGRQGAWRLIESLLNGPKDKPLHNAKFDLQFFKVNLERRGLTYDPQAIHDTMLLNYALDERPMGKFKAHALEHLAAIRYDAPDYGIPMGKFLEEWAGADAQRRKEMRLELHEYLAQDTYWTARLFPDLWNECMEEDEKLLDLYETLFIPGTLALAEVELHGLNVDVEMLETSLRGLKQRAARTLQRVRDASGIEDLNPNSPAQVKKLVYEDLGMTAERAMEALVEQAESHKRVASRDAKEGARSRGTYTDPKRLKESATAAPVLRMLARGYPEHEDLIEDICEYRNITKNAGAYIEGWLRRVDSDGRLRGNFNLHGTATGRLSSSDPNLQNVPPASHTGIPIRSAIVAPEGKVIIGADYKQLEVRVAAQLSQDPAMLELFESGRDVHGEISRAIYNMPAEKISQYMRMLGKIVLFGLLYGRSPNSVATGPEQEDIVQRGGRRQTPEEVEEFFGNLLDDWKVYAEWRRGLRDAAYEHGEVQLPSGRKRRFEFIPVTDGGAVGRRGLNTPVQGTASDVTLDALIRVQRILPEGASVILTVHDAIYIECWEDDAEEVTELLRVAMEDSPFFAQLTGDEVEDPHVVPLKADIKVARRWDEEDDKVGSGVIRVAAE